MIKHGSTERERALDWGARNPILIGLATVAFVGVCVTETSAHIDTPSDPANCTRAPTLRCVFGLSFAAANLVFDPYRRAKVLVRAAEAQFETEATGEATGEPFSRVHHRRKDHGVRLYREDRKSGLDGRRGCPGQSSCLVEYCERSWGDSARRTNRKRRWPALRTSQNASFWTATVRRASSASREGSVGARSFGCAASNLCASRPFLVTEVSGQEQAQLKAVS